MVENQMMCKEEVVVGNLVAAEAAVAALFAAEVAMAALEVEVQPPCYPLGGLSCYRTP